MNLKELKKQGLSAFRANMLVCIGTALIMALVVEASADFQSGSLFSAIATGEQELNADVMIYIIIREGMKLLGALMTGSMGMFLYTLMGGYGYFGILAVILLSNMIEIGGDNLFLKNARNFKGKSIRKAYMNELFFCFKRKRYWRLMMIQLYRTSFTVGWGMLLIVPGVIKALEYRMIPYLLVDNPEMTMNEVFAKSKEMMNGHKKEAFLLDLSFIGWDLLGLVSMGITSVMFSNPYKNAAKAEFYLKLAEEGK